MRNHESVSQFDICRYRAALASNHDMVMFIIKPMNDVRMDRGSAILVCN